MEIIKKLRHIEFKLLTTKIKNGKKYNWWKQIKREGTQIE